MPTVDEQGRPGRRDEGGATAEAAMRGAVAEFVRAVWGSGQPPTFMPGVVRRGLDAAEPFLAERAREEALAPIRALCDEWDSHVGLDPLASALIEDLREVVGYVDHTHAPDHFDRTICATCDGMHYVCRCGQTQDPCSGMP